AVQEGGSADVVADLSRLDAPTLWILAEDDIGAPPDATRERLIDLEAQGRPVTLLQFPDTDHGIVRFEIAETGIRTALGFAPGHYQSVLDWALTGRLGGTYGDGRILAPSNP
ncbi:hypothetical protein LTR94_028049, partial [Friedmanniomyces endolithicus]